MYVEVLECGAELVRVDGPLPVRIVLVEKLLHPRDLQKKREKSFMFISENGAFRPWKCLG